MSGSEIAIIGMACRFPGAGDLRAYWDLLVNGRGGLCRLDDAELVAEGVAQTVLADPRYVRVAGALDRIDCFDAGFWEIGAHEAALMDPQQRIALEVAWHALEDASIDPRRADATIGVFASTAISTYLLYSLHDRIAGPSTPSQLLTMLGNDKDYIATQLAYRLDLTGPAIAVQTACSSSLVAVHLACQSLIAGECDIAIAGGVSVRVPHRVGYLYEPGAMLSPDGHCRSFAEEAAGTVFGSGCGFIVLRRLEEAGRDRVRAVLLGSAVNNDGHRKIGFTAPSQDRQSAVIAEAIAVAGVTPADIGYVEGHGTATSLGDPVEVAALADAFRGIAPASVALGSAKSNIGHTETAAGVAGLIKTVLMLEHRTMVPTLHAATPSRRIPWAQTPFRLAQEARAWDEKLIAGVSSFGIGGTNAHVVVAAAPSIGPPVERPLTPFRRERHWIAASEETRLLGAAIPTPFGAMLHPIAIEGARQTCLADHVVADEALIPAALYLALFSEAADGVASDIAVHRPLKLADAAGMQLWRASDGGMRVMAEHGGGWQCLAEARVGNASAPLAAWSVEAGEAIDGTAWAARMAVAGLAFGPAFRLIARLRRDRNVAWAALDQAAPRTKITVLDAGLQALGAAVATGGEGFRPVEIGAFAARGEITGATSVLARLTTDGEEAKAGDVLWLDERGNVLAQAQKIVCRRARPAAADMLYRLRWRADLDPAATAPQPALERIARHAARRALAAVPSPVRPELVGLLRPHAAQADAEPVDIGTACRALAERHPAHAAEIALVARCAEALPGVLAEQADPLDLLFGGGEGAPDLYRQSPLAREMNRIAAAVATASRPRRVIEIGGGTAATTQALRAALPEVVQYLFTDISPAFFAAAARRFADWPAFATGSLDIGRDPAEQAVAIGGWDVVVAANVLHAAPDLTAALRHACRLLAPGGRLVLIEGTERSARLDITFGLTSAWTQQRDRALRPEYPLVPVPVWIALLRDAGLDEPVAVAELGGQAVLTATAGPPRWVAIGRDRSAAAACNLPFRQLGAVLPAAPLDGVVALAGMEEAADPLADLLAVTRALAERPEAPRLLVPTRNGEAIGAGGRPIAAHAALGGFVRTLQHEHPALRSRSVDLGDAGPAVTLAIERALDDGEDRVAWRDGTRHVSRLERLPDTSPAPAPARLTTDVSLAPMAVPRPGPGQITIRVRAAGINYKDALTAAGQIPAVEAGLGGECAGEIAEIGAGVTGFAVADQVVAVGGGALATHLCADARLVLPKPPELDFVQAAGVPIAGVTAWYALRHLARVRPGERVLIHAATGGVGGFALRIARQAGAEIVATAGSEAKRALLRQLGVREVYSSRDIAFAAMAPVDIVLSALSGESRAAGLRLVRPGGHFVEIGRTGILSPAEIAAVRPDIVYHIVALDQVEAPVFAGLFREVLAAVAADPSLLPPVTAMSLGGARSAFEAMMRADHVGKLVALPAQPIEIRADGSYVVTGGLGGLGPEIAGWLESRGAGGIILVARRRMQAAELPANAVIGDVADPATLHAVDRRARELGLPPIRGVVHAAGALEDALVASLEPASFARLAAPKLGGVEAILAHWPDLDLLIGFSSAGALLGSAGQAAHTAASAAMDAVLAAAAAAGRPALTVNWGAWRHQGAAATRGVEVTLAAGMGSIEPGAGFAALDRVLASRAAQAAVLPIDWATMRASPSLPAVLRDLAAPEIRLETKPAPPMAPPISEAMPAAERRAWLRERIAAECAGMLSIRGPIEPRRPLQELGLDSLAALELRNRLSRLAGSVLPAGLLFDYPTIATLTEHLATAHFGLPPEAGPVPALPEVHLADDALADASEAELDSALAAFETLYGGAQR